MNTPPIDLDDIQDRAFERALKVGYAPHLARVVAASAQADVWFQRATPASAVKHIHAPRTRRSYLGGDAA